MTQRGEDLPSRAVVPLLSPPDATVVIPGSKSYTNRALILAALAQGTSTITNALVADDSEAMLEALDALGVVVERDDKQWLVQGLGGAIPAGPLNINARFSGTTSRFLLPVLALGVGPYVLDGHEPLRKRPIGPIAEALLNLGAEVEDVDGTGLNFLPLSVRGGNLSGGQVEVSAEFSSQFVTGLLQAGPYMRRGLTLNMVEATASRPYLTMTTSVMSAFGVTVERPNENQFVVPAGGYVATTYEVEPDASTASYVFAAAAITGGRIRVPGLGRRSLQGDMAFLDVLSQMGAHVEVNEDWSEVRGSADIRGVDIDMSDFPDMAQTVAAVAVFGDKPTRVRGVSLIRHHETDRIRAVVTEMRRLGIQAEEFDDGFVIHPGTPQPAQVETYDDHRMAMSFALLGLRVPGIEIVDPVCVGKTFPGFFDVLDSLGAN